MSLTKYLRPAEGKEEEEKTTNNIVCVVRSLFVLDHRKLPSRYKKKGKVEKKNIGMKIKPEYCIFKISSVFCNIIEFLLHGNDHHLVLPSHPFFTRILIGTVFWIEEEEKIEASRVSSPCAFGRYHIRYTGMWM